MTAPSPPGRAPPEAILTEVNGVLVREIWTRFAEALARESGTDPRHLLTVLGARRRAFERGAEDLATFHRAVVLAADLPTPFDRFHDLLLGEVLEEIPENRAVLARVRGELGVPVRAVANLPAPIFDALDDAFGLAGDLDGVLLSGREGVAKPNAQLYIQAIDDAALPPTRLLAIDPDPENLAGAAEWGIPGLLLTDPATLPGELARRFPGL